MQRAGSHSQARYQLHLASGGKVEVPAQRRHCAYHRGMWQGFQRIVQVDRPATPSAAGETAPRTRSQSMISSGEPKDATRTPNLFRFERIDPARFLHGSTPVPSAA